MANEKQFNTRVQLKNDIEANWVKATGFTPYAGELVVYNAEVEGVTPLPEDPTYTGGGTQYLRSYWITYPRIKIGDGTNKVKDLPFITDEVWQQISQAQKFWAEDDNSGNVTLRATTLAPANKGVY